MQGTGEYDSFPVTCPQRSSQGGGWGYVETKINRLQNQVYLGAHHKTTQKEGLDSQRHLVISVAKGEKLPAIGLVKSVYV